MLKNCANELLGKYHWQTHLPKRKPLRQFVLPLIISTPGPVTVLDLEDNSQVMHPVRTLGNLARVLFGLLVKEKLVIKGFSGLLIDPTCQPMPLLTSPA